MRAAVQSQRGDDDIPEEPARRDSTRVPLLCLDGPTENMDASPLALKAHAHEIHEKAGNISNTMRTMARTGRYEEGAPHKAGAGANRPRVQR
jgi:hypothetical protein